MAYGVRLPQIPNAALEPKIPVCQCADRTNVDDIPGIGIVQLMPGIQTDLGMISAIKNPKIVCF